MEPTSLIEEMLAQSPTIGVMLYLIIYNSRRLEQKIDDCNEHMVTLVSRLLDSLASKKDSP